ncbi:MAG TPA: nucleotidyltransferase domain-containing protein [Solirubrobacterales bacterium]|nr:nucleotidyltransferase domain-containing protein [Solirubrobacterales bacterium]
MASRDLIEQAGKILAETAGTGSKVILFGSHARGDESRTAMLISS